MKPLPDAPEPLPSPVADSHCHLDTAEDYTGLGPAEAVSLAARVGVDRIVQVGCDVESSRWAVRTAAANPSIVASVAIHPNDAARLGDDLDAGLDALAAIVAEHAAGPDLRGVGETGLDFFRTREPDGIARQKHAFARHIALAREHDLTLVIHDREAHAEILDVLDAEGVPDRVVMHCFSGDADFARRCLDRGAWLSFPGPVTFKPNEYLRDALRATPQDRLLTETDAPFLAPMPHRGHANASYLIPLTVRFMAEQREDDLAGLCRALSENTSAAFGGDWTRA